jgi:hypothetical protein
MGQENIAFFYCLFLNKLPRELRILISEVDIADKQALGGRDYLFAAHNSKHAHDLVAAVATSSPGARRGAYSGDSVPRSQQRQRGSGISGFFLEISISKCGVPHFWCGLFEIPQADN